jgi:uncharacterized protein YigE (DUF2233 family)
MQAGTSFVTQVRLVPVLLPNAGWRQFSYPTQAGTSLVIQHRLEPVLLPNTASQTKDWNNQL